MVRTARPKLCEGCGGPFPRRAAIDGTIRNLNNRRFCLTCSPFGQHNTSRSPIGVLSAADLAEVRRKKRNAKTYRYQKKMRIRLRVELLASRGGCCEACGYGTAAAALEFHHRDANSKEFAVSRYGASRQRMWSEAAKCDLLCANCHRARHDRVKTDGGDPVVRFRQRLKVRAVAAMGGACVGCDRREPIEALEFHHLDPTTKEFGISTEGIARRWDKVEAELAKCVLLCANCHREIHAGARQLGEDEGPYRSCEAVADPLHKRCA